MTSKNVPSPPQRRLPDGWCWATFSDVATIASNLVPPKDWGDLPHIAPDNIERDTGRLLPFRTISEDAIKSANHFFKPGQLLYSKIRPYLNKCVRVDFQGLCSADMYPLDVHIDAAYLLHYILSRQFVSAVGKASGSRTVLPKINREQLAEVPVATAPIPEQKRISEAIESYVTRLDAAVATLEGVQRNLKRYRASVLKAAIEGRLVPTEAELARKEKHTYESADALLARVLKERRRRWEEGELAKLKVSGKTPKHDKWKARYDEPKPPETSKLPELAQGWCWASLDQLLTKPLANGMSVPHGDGFPVLRLTCIREGIVDLSERRTGAWGTIDPVAFAVRPDDFLVVRGNGSINRVGRGARVPSVTEPVAFPDTLIRVEIAVEALCPALLARWWDSPPVRRHLERRAKTTAGIYKVNQTDLEETPVPLPPYAEQIRIQEEIERIDSVAEASIREVAATAVRCARLRQSVLKWAFEGKLVAQDPADQPAEDLLARIRAERSATAPTTNTGVRKARATA